MTIEIIANKFLKIGDAIYNIDKIDAIENLYDGRVEIVINGEHWTFKVDFYILSEVLKKVRRAK